MNCSKFPSPVNPRLQNRRAFTLVEMLVVIATVAILSSMLLPALCRAKSQATVADCASNYRQWTVSVNLYTSDFNNFLPGFGSGDQNPPQSYGKTAWDVGVNLIPVMYKYGLNIPTWFCPVRSREFTFANLRLQRLSGYNTNSTIRTLMDLTNYFNSVYSGETILVHNYWVTRHNAGNGTDPYPITGQVFQGTKLTNTDGLAFPSKTTDQSAALVPFISDKCFDGNSATTSGGSMPTSTNIANIDPSSAHFSNGKLVSVNAAYADGHVETRKPSQIQARYVSDSGSVVSFY